MSENAKKRRRWWVRHVVVPITVALIIGGGGIVGIYKLIIGPKNEELARQEKTITELKEKMREVEGRAGTNPTICQRYDIRITSPRQGESVGECARISGTFGGEVPKMGAQLFIIGDGPQYWPQDVVEFDTVNRKWHGRAYIGGEPPQDVTVMVATVGNSGRILCDYYKKVGEETGDILYEKFAKKESLYLSLKKLTDDIVECDRIRVRRTR